MPPARPLFPAQRFGSWLHEMQVFCVCFTDLCGCHPSSQCIGGRHCLCSTGPSAQGSPACLLLRRRCPMSFAKFLQLSHGCRLTCRAETHVCITQVQKQFNTLAPEDRPALLSSLEACLQVASQRCTRAISPLAVALAALVVQWPAWEGSLQQIGESLSSSTGDLTRTVL